MEIFLRKHQKPVQNLNQSQKLRVFYESLEAESKISYIISIPYILQEIAS